MQFSIRLLVTSLLLLAVTSLASAGEVKVEKDAESGFHVHVAKQGNTEIRLAPEAGCNVYSIKYKGTELLKTPKSLVELPGFVYGNPILYPSPNRVRDGVFSFGGKEYRFEPNNDGNFLHGLVHSVAWNVVHVSSGNDHATIECRYEIEPGTQVHEGFPLEHTIGLTVKVTDNAVRFTYEVDNSQGKGAVPYGWAFHPWFLYQGARKETFLTVPATHLMESIDLLPSGKLLDLEGTKFDARKGVTLEGFVIDDVYYGMQPEKPTVIDFRDKRLKISLAASKEFTHLVVYTPADQEWFCVENQTSSTDAHNLYAKGLKKVPNLIIVEPGEKSSGYAEFQMSNY